MRETKAAYRDFALKFEDNNYAHHRSQNLESIFLPSILPKKQAPPS